MSSNTPSLAGGTWPHKPFPRDHGHLSRDINTSLPIPTNKLHQFPETVGGEVLAVHSLLTKILHFAHLLLAELPSIQSSLIQNGPGYHKGEIRHRVARTKVSATIFLPTALEVARLWGPSPGYGFHFGVRIETCILVKMSKRLNHRRLLPYPGGGWAFSTLRTGIPLLRHQKDPEWALKQMIGPHVRYSSSTEALTCSSECVS